MIVIQCCLVYALFYLMVILAHRLSGVKMPPYNFKERFHYLLGGLHFIVPWIFGAYFSVLPIQSFFSRIQVSKTGQVLAFPFIICLIIVYSFSFHIYHSILLHSTENTSNPSWIDKQIIGYEVIVNRHPRITYFFLEPIVFMFIGYISMYFIIGFMYLSYLMDRIFY